MKKKIKFAVIILLIGGMIMSYTRVNWQNAPSTATPVNAENLNTMDEGIADAHSQLAETTPLAKIANKNRITVNPLTGITVKETFYRVMDMDKNGVQYAQGAGTGTQLYKSVDNGETFTLVHDFGSTQKIANIKCLNNGELVVALNADRANGLFTKILVSSNNQSTWTMKLEFTKLVAEVNTMWGMSVIDNNILINEYGTIADYPSLGHGAHKVYLSRDNGDTFNEILDIADYVTNPNATHVHGSVYDKYWDRIWVIFGDYGFYHPTTYDDGLMYTDDFGATWNKVDIPRQLLAGYAFEDRVIFTSDAIPNGIWTFERGKKEDEPSLKFVHLFDDKQRIHYIHSGQFYKRDETSPLLIPVSFANGDVNATGTKYILATYDGVTFTEIWRDIQNHQSTMHFLAYAPTNDSKLTGFMIGDNRHDWSVVEGAFSVKESIDHNPISVPTSINTDYINARDLGIKGWDFDESPELGNAITYCAKNGKVLYIPKDMTIKTVDVHVDGLDGIKIVCDGKIQFDTIPAIYNRSMLKFTNCSNIDIPNINFVGNTSNDTGDLRIDHQALNFENCNNVDVGTVSFSNINGRALKILGSNNVRFDVVRCTGNKTASEFLYLINSSNVTIETLYAKDFMKVQDNIYFINVRTLTNADIIDGFKIVKGYVRDESGYSVYVHRIQSDGVGYIKDVDINLEIARPSNFDNHGVVYVNQVQNFRLYGELYSERTDPTTFLGIGIDLNDIDGINMDFDVRGFKIGSRLGYTSPVKNGVVKGSITDSYQHGLMPFKLENVDFVDVTFKNNGISGTHNNILGSGASVVMTNVRFLNNKFGKGANTQNITLNGGVVLTKVSFEDCDFSEWTGNVALKLLNDVAGVTRINNKGLNYLNAIPIYSYWGVGEIVYNTNPTAGGYLGWVCTVAGNPGTWKGFGLIQA